MWLQKYNTWVPDTDMLINMKQTITHFISSVSQYVSLSGHFKVKTQKLTFVTVLLTGD